MKVVLLLIITILLSSVASGQKTYRKITISGVVKDSLQRAVEGANIFIDNKKTSYVTNKQGYFKIKVKPEVMKILVISSLKGGSETIIDGRTIINFTLSGSVKLRPESINNNENDEIIDVGYGTMKKKDVISGKTSLVSPRFSSYSNIYDLIRNELSGVLVKGTSVYVQGSSSFVGSSEPLFVVDGIAVEQINDVSPNDVKSIQLLKGPSTSIYGMRGANGVIFIKTFRGTDKQ